MKQLVTKSKKTGLLILVSLFILCLLSIAFGSGTPALAKLIEDSSPKVKEPTGLTAIADNHCVSLTWDEKAKDVDLLHYQLDYRGEESEWQEVTIEDPSATSFTVASLTNDETYEFRLRVQDTGLNWSKYSRTIIATPADVSLGDLRIDGITVADFSPDALAYDMPLPLGTLLVPEVTVTVNDPSVEAVVIDAEALPGSTTIIVHAPGRPGPQAIRTYTVNFRLAALVTVSFDSNGGGDVAPIQLYEGEALDELPVPNKDGSIWLGWFTDSSFGDQVFADTTITSDMTLYARYADIQGVQEADEVTTTSAVDREPSFAIHVVSSDTNMGANDVKALLQLEAVDNTPFAGLSVSGAGGAYTVTAAEGYTRGSSYKLTLMGDGLTFEDPDPETDLAVPASVRTYCFTIQKDPVENLELAPDVLEIPAGDVGTINPYGGQTSILSLPLATTEIDLSDLDDTGTFIYTNASLLLHVGQVLAIYEGTPPSQRDANADYSDQAVAYVEVTAIDGDMVTYKTSDAEDVLFTPDVLPVDPEDDTDGYPVGSQEDNDSLTIAVSDMTYAGEDYAEMGLTPDTVVEAGDYLAFAEGGIDEDAAVTYALIASVELNGDSYVIAYTDVTEDELYAAMDLYSSHDQAFEEAVKNLDIASMEESMEQQAIDSGFAEAAAEYLGDLALRTDGFKSQLVALAAAESGDEGGGVISNLEVTADIDTEMTHFAGLPGLHAAVAVDFDIAVGEDLNIHVHAAFEEELRVTFNADGKAVWKKKWGIFPYIADYRFTGNVDLYNYTGISVNATITTDAGDGSLSLEDFDISDQIKDLMGAENYRSEDISAGTREFYELYSEMLANEHDYVNLIEQEISRVEAAVDPLHIMVVGLTLEFVVGADVDLSLGADFDYTKGTRYVFTLLLKAKTSTSDQITLVPETYNFDFYVMGTLALRTGVVARVEVGLFSLKLDSIGLELELGPYVRLWGYFFYELHHANNLTTSKTSGALYLELGIYLETRFLAQVLDGKYSYNPTLYSHEWPLWSAGSRYNIYDFAYTLTDATDDIGLKGTTRTYTLPTSVFNMNQLDLTEGDISTLAKPYTDFTITFTNSNFSQSNGVISVTPPAGQHIVEGNMTISWNAAPLSFTTVPISRTYHVRWDDLPSSYTLSFNSQGGNTLSPISGPYGTPLTLPTPTKAGYTFAGWYTSTGYTTAFTATSMPAQSQTVYAKWNPSTNTRYTVRHYQQTLAGTYSDPPFVESFTGATGASVTPAVKIYPGFTSPSTQTVTIAADGSTVVNCYYTRNSYLLTLQPNNGGSVTSSSVKYGAPVITSSVSRAGYTFVAWYDDGDMAYTTANTMPAANLTLHAGWIANTNTRYTVKHYQQTVAGSSHDLVETQTFYGTTASQVTPAVKTYTGFTSPSTQTVTIAGDGSAVVEYRYTRNSYQLTFKPGAPDADIVKTVVYQGQISPPAVARTGYTFDGWYSDAACTNAFTATTMPAQNVTVYAKWTSLGVAYTVKYWQEIVAGGLHELAETEIFYGAGGSQVTAPVKTYTGFETPTAQTVTIASDGSTVVEYRYTRNSYELTFHNRSGGLEGPAVILRYGASIIFPTPTREGFTLDGWYETTDYTGTAFTETTMPARNLELYAKWSAPLPANSVLSVSGTLTGVADGGTSADCYDLPWDVEADVWLRVTFDTWTGPVDDLEITLMHNGIAVCRGIYPQIAYWVSPLGYGAYSVVIRTTNGGGSYSFDINDPSHPLP